MTLQQPIAYSLSAEQVKRPCHNCGKLGHWARECKPDDTRKKTDDNNKVSSTNNDINVIVKSNG
jgi:hypothetical protein